MERRKVERALFMMVGPRSPRRLLFYTISEVDQSKRVVGADVIEYNTSHSRFLSPLEQWKIVALPPKLLLEHLTATIQK